MKKTIVLVLAIAILLFSAACASGQVTAETGSDKITALKPPDNFDARLAGDWTCVSAQENGQIRLATLDDGSMILNRSRLDFTFGGSVFGTFFDDSRASSELQPLFEQVSAKDGVLTIPYEMEGLAITIQYDFKDVNKSSQADNNYGNYFAKFDNDQLTLVITGLYKSGPTNQGSIDSTFVFEKIYPVLADSNSFGVAMIGSWSDNMGNTWTFTLGNKEEAKRLPETSFYLVDSNGKRYDGKQISIFGAAQDDPDCTESVSFYFVDTQSSADIVRAKRVSFDGYTLSLELENGSQLILQRLS